jgi:general secretion pathway protein L
MMRNTVLIEAADPDLHSVRWLVLDAAGAAPDGVRTGTLQEAAAATASRRVLLLVPATELLLTRARVPSRNRQRVLKAVPYALEEQLAGDVDGLHFALGAARDEEYPVAVVARSRMDGWLAACASAGLQPEALLPDLLALPLAEGRWTLRVQGEQAAVRCGPTEGFGCERANLAQLLRLWPVSHPSRESATDPLSPPADATPPPLQALGVPPAELAGEGFELLPPDPRDPLLAMAEVLAADGLPLNLLQGRYSRSEQLSRLWQPWRATAALLVTGLALGMVYLGIDYYRLGQEQARLGVAIESVFRQALPDAARMVNPRAQLEQRLAALQGGPGSQADFLALLQQAGPVLRGTGGLELRGANYRDGTLDLELTVADLQVLDQVKQRLAQDGGLMAEIQSATADGDKRVSSRLRIAGAGS